MQGIDFSRIRVHGGSQHKGFEDLVCHLASRSKPENACEFIPKDGAGGDAGVECYWKLIDGSEHVWQAKYFIDRLKKTNWKQISRSVETALNKHPKLTKYYVCLPIDRTDIRRVNKNGKPVLSESDWWDHYVKKWTAIAAEKSMDVEFVYWGKLQITSLILQSDPRDLANLTNYWFGAADGTIDAWSHRRFSTELVDQEIKKATDTLRKSRFFPEFNELESSSILAGQLIDGSLSEGTATTRSHALAWCARILHSEDREKAEKCVEYAKVLASCHETAIAEAFLTSLKGNKNEALSALAVINSPMSRTAAFLIVAHHEGWPSAVAWLRTAGIDANNLDPDGKLALLKCQLDLSDWIAAQETCNLLTDDDLQEAPILHQLVAMTYLLSTVPVDRRSLVLGQIPFDTYRFPLDDQESAMDARRAARRHFVEAQEVALHLGMTLAAAVAEEYALWLELRDPGEWENGRERLATKLGNLESALRFVRFGVQFGLKLDFNAVDQEIERQIALNGKPTFDAALARFTLIFIIDTPEKALAYVNRHQDEIAGLIDKRLVASIRIELLLKIGQIEGANEVLNLLIKEGLPETEISRHKQMIAEAEGADPIESLKKQFRNTDSPDDLGILVDALEKRQAWDDLCEYGAIQFERTRVIPDAELFAVALYNTQKTKQLAEFLESNGSLLSRSRQLKLLLCWTLYYEGKLLEARSKIEELSDWWDNPNCRELRVNIGISLGDWNSLSSVITHECANKDDRTAEDLIRTAQLAFHLELPLSQVKELTFAAVNKANDNANVLADAYYLSTIAGWENTEEVADWLQRAATLSGDDGPIRRATIQEFADQKPAWDRIQSEVRRKLRRGELPMFGAGHALNRSLIEIMTYPFYVNMNETDPRRGDAVFAYSGKKQHASIDCGGKTAMDVSALLTLGSLDILDKVLDTFEEVHISHATLGWFFVERKKAMFHQPSRIAEARQIRDILNKGSLQILTCNGGGHDDLVDQVGDELAQLITEAEDTENEDGHHCLVICPYPVNRAGSLMDEEVDLTGHAKVLSSCMSVVEELRRKGRITEREKRHAHAYLKLHEKPWPNQPAIADGATLYLTNLATTYFQQLGLLEKLKVAGFRPVVSPSVVLEVDLLISYGNTSGRIETTIERIRSALRTGIAKGKVKTAPMVSSVKPIGKPDESPAQSIPDHPTLGIISLAKKFDAIVIDDRCIGQQFPRITSESTVIPMFTTLDVIDALATASSITDQDRMEYRRILRSAGYILVPVDVEELIHHLNDASVNNGAVVETAELKAIRENLLLVRQSDCVLSSGKDDWLRSLFRIFKEAIEGLWKAGDCPSDVQARSDWILSQLDIRNWAHCFDKETSEHMVGHGYGAHIMSLLLLPIEGLHEVREDYWRWIEDRALAPIKEQDPDLYIELVDWFRGFVAVQVDSYVNESKGNGK